MLCEIDVVMVNAIYGYAKLHFNYKKIHIHHLLDTLSTMQCKIIMTLGSKS